MTTATARFSPFGSEANCQFDWTPGDSLGAILRRAVRAMETACGKPGAYAWFLKEGIIRVNGARFPDRAMWPHVKPKPDTIVELVAPLPEGGKVGKIGLLLASVALTLATGFVAGGGLARLGLGAAFGAGTFGANLAAAGIGLAGSLLVNALTPAPSAPKGPGAQRALAQAGVGVNAAGIGELIPSVIGRMRVSPPLVAPPFRSTEGERVYANLMVGLVGTCDVSELVVDGFDPVGIDGAVIDIKKPGEGDTFLSAETVVQSGLGMELSNYQMDVDSASSDELEDQTTPENSYSKWHSLPNRKPGCLTYSTEFAFDGGIATATGGAGFVPVRFRVRPVGSSIWRGLPTLHFRSKKQFGGFRQKVDLSFRVPKPVGYQGFSDKFSAFLATDYSSVGQPFEYHADPYFQNSNQTEVLPNFSGYTSGVYTVTASSSIAGDEAWRPVSGSDSAWNHAVGDPDIWWQVDLGIPRAVGSFVLINTVSAINALTPLKFDLLGSNDGINFTTLAEVRRKNQRGQNQQVPTPGIYRYYRFAFRQPKVMVQRIHLHVEDARAGLDNSYARHVYLGEDGFELFLRPDDWPDVEYEVQVRRGWAGVRSDFSVPSYYYETQENKGGFFSHLIAGGSPWRIALSQDDIQSSTRVEVVSQVFPERPIDAAAEQRMTRIALKIPDRQVNGVSAIFTGYAREWTGTEWADQATPSRNPAAYYRDALLLQDKNARPLSGELLSESNLVTAFNHAVSKGFKCDMLVQGGTSLPSVLQLLASSMRSSPQQTYNWGLVIDRDRTAETPSGAVTPQVSRNLGTRLAYRKIPHAVRVTYFDETDDYKPKDLVVYRDGYTVATATDIEAEDDAVNTSSAAVQSQWRYNLKQMTQRRQIYRREVGPQGRQYARGDLLVMADDTLQRDVYTGFIKGVLTSGGFVVGLEVYGTLPLSLSAEQFSMAGDVNTVADVNSFAGQFAAMVQLVNGDTIVLPINQVVDTQTITFVTPPLDAGQFGSDLPLAVGPPGRVGQRVIVQGKEKSGEESWILTLVREAPEIHA